MKKVFLILVISLGCFCNADLIGHWSLDEDSGDVAYDTLESHDGTLMNYTSNSWTSGQIGGALGFDGINDYVTMGDVSEYENLEQITICAWIDLTQNVSDRHFIFGQENLFKMDVQYQKIRFLLGSNWANWSGDQLVSNTTISLNTWYHVAATYDGEYKRIYINGVNTDTLYAPIAGDIGSSGYDVTIGSHYDYVSGEYFKFFKGYIDDVAIFDEALSQEDIVKVMTNGAASVLPLKVSIDIKPQACPNPFNVKSKGVLPVAILGSEEFDVSSIVLTSIRLSGVAPIRDNFEDVASIKPDADECECNTDGPDGFVDLILQFDTQEIVEVLGEVNKGDILILSLTGVLYDETPIEGADCIVIVGNQKES